MLRNGLFIYTFLRIFLYVIDPMDVMFYLMRDVILYSYVCSDANSSIQHTVHSKFK